MISADSTETGRKYGLPYEISSEQSLLESVIVENFSYLNVIGYLFCM